jgi:hypothetical protein
MSSDDERLPELFVRGAAMYKAQFNAENPLGTMQSIEYALRGLDKALADGRERAARVEKALADFEEQAGRPYEHEGRLKELLGRQAQLNALLDLDKGEKQVAEDTVSSDDAEHRPTRAANSGPQPPKGPARSTYSPHQENILSPVATRTPRGRSALPETKV